MRYSRLVFELCRPIVFSVTGSSGAVVVISGLVIEMWEVAGECGVVAR